MIVSIERNKDVVLDIRLSLDIRESDDMADSITELIDSEAIYDGSIPDRPLRTFLLELRNKLPK